VGYKLTERSTKALEQATLQWRQMTFNFTAEQTKAKEEVGGKQRDHKLRLSNDISVAWIIIQ
jgi:hypothetical protein